MVPDGVYDRFQELLGQRWRSARDAWMAKFAEYGKQFPELASHLDKIQKREMPEGWDADLPAFPADPMGLAGRDASGKVENAIAKRLPWLFGGATDLAPSIKTRLTFEGAGDLEANNYGGCNLHFGIREHAMGSIVNGLSLSKLRPFGSGFLIFSDYRCAPIRLSALMEIPVIFIFTHDSIGVGEDGPTHQPVEQLISLRAIPGLIVMRPGEANEVVCLILSRQNMPTLDRTKYASASGVARGAYILADAIGGRPDVILIGTGSDVSLCVDAYEKLTQEGIKARVSVEQASVFSWDRYARLRIGLHTFGASAPLKELQNKFGFTPDAVAAAAREELAKAQ